MVRPVSGGAGGNGCAAVRRRSRWAPGPGGGWGSRCGVGLPRSDDATRTSRVRVAGPTSSVPGCGPAYGCPGAPWTWSGGGGDAGSRRSPSPNAGGRRRATGGRRVRGAVHVATTTASGPTGSRGSAAWSAAAGPPVRGPRRPAVRAGCGRVTPPPDPPAPRPPATAGPIPGPERTNPQPTHTSLLTARSSSPAGTAGPGLAGKAPPRAAASVAAHHAAGRGCE